MWNMTIIVLGKLIKNTNRLLCFKKTNNQYLVWINNKMKNSQVMCNWVIFKVFKWKLINLQIGCLNLPFVN